MELWEGGVLSLKSVLENRRALVLRVFQLSESLLDTVRRIQKFDPNQPRDAEGQWSDAGGEGVGGGGSSSVTISTNTAASFNTVLSSAYKAQGVQDWEAGDYFEQLPYKGYFGNGNSFLINRALRSERKLASGQKDVHEFLSSKIGTHGITVSSDSTLYRAVDGVFASKLVGMKAGESFRDGGWVSAAGTKAATKQFGDVVMKIKLAPPGQKALAYRPETELLFPPGRTFTVGSVKQSGKKTFVEVVMR